MATAHHDFDGVPLRNSVCHMSGWAEIEYSSRYTGFIITSVYLNPYQDPGDQSLSPKPLCLEGEWFAEAVKALERYDVKAIEESIVADRKERAEQDREAKDRTRWFGRRATVAA